LNSRKIQDEVLANIELSGVCTSYFKIDDLIRQGGESEVSITSVLDEGELIVKNRLIKLVNSGIYRHPQKVATVAEAVRLVGHVEIRDLVLGISLMEVLNRLSPDIVTRESFWKHGLATGIACASLAGYLAPDNIARFFLAGLLHDIGSLFMYPQISERSLMNILKKRHASDALYDLEEEVLGYHHAEVGGVFAANLKLPIWLQEAIGYHHAPMDAPHHSLEAATVHVADIIVNAMRCGSRGEFLVPPLATGAWEKLQLPAGVLQAVMLKIDSLMPIVTSAMLDEHVIDQSH